MAKSYKKESLEDLFEQYIQKINEAKDLKEQGNFKGSAKKSADAEALQQTIEFLTQLKMN